VKPKNVKSNDNWKTPEDFYKKLNEKYNFDFDPCPLNSTFDGLSCEWGKSNFVNPPYSRKLKELFILKAIEESKKGKRVVMLLPVSTSTKIFHDHIIPNCKNLEFIKGRLKFNNSKGSGTFDSMLVIF
jgi:hypothetical protein